LIDVVFSDIDGCFVPQNYDPLGTVQTDEESEPYFEYYRNYTGPHLVLCTGRAWVNTLGILRRAGFLPNQRAAWPDQPVLCENGIDVIVDPVNGHRTSLIDESAGLAHLRPVVERIKGAGVELELGLGKIREGLEADFEREVTPIQLIKKEFCVTARIPRFGGTSQQVDASRFYQRVTQAVQEPLGSLVKDGRVRIILSATAVDITLPIGKGDGVRYLLDRYETPPERAAFIGDSAPDIEGMQQVGLACCPSNAVPPVKDFVHSLGSRGYVSPLSYAEAEIDILNRFYPTLASASDSVS
jgi:hydroxymethylpyrimidine pyrophosphatase-like HAD family hydrolase